jgi:hypothetical protein
MMWAPQPELWFGIDGDRVDLVPHGGAFISQGPGTDYLQAATTLAVLKRIGAASSVHGSALGFRFELTGAQRMAFGTFVDRLSSSRNRPTS